jgi:hypothetical protein
LADHNRSVCMLEVLRCELLDMPLLLLLLPAVMT